MHTEAHVYQNMLIMVATATPSSVTNVEVCKNLVADTSLVPSTHTVGLHVEPKVEPNAASKMSASSFLLFKSPGGGFAPGP